MAKLPPEDIKLFQAAVKGVKRLRTDKMHFPKRQAVKRGKVKLVAVPQEEFQFSDHLREVVTADAKLFFARSGVQEKVLRSLRLGKIAQMSELDLHGVTVIEARTLLSHFLNDCVEQNLRCVRIVHGRGKLTLTPPPLKNQINNWLRQYPAVLAFCSAIPREGGVGAVYVLLKRRKSE